MKNIYLNNNILYHHDTMKELFKAYTLLNRTEFVSFSILKNVKYEHAILIWQVLDIVEELNQKKDDNK